MFVSSILVAETPTDCTTAQRGGAVYNLLVGHRDSGKNQEIRSLQEVHTAPYLVSLYLRTSLRTGQLFSSELNAGNLEACATLRATSHADVPIVGLNDLLHDTQSEPGSLGIR